MTDGKLSLIEQVIARGLSGKGARARIAELEALLENAKLTPMQIGQVHEELAKLKKQVRPE
jgi:hypothetical protein